MLGKTSARHGVSGVSSGTVACEENSPRIIALRDLEQGQRAVINRLSCRRLLRRRLMNMGIVAGTPVVIERVAPLGDPIDLRIKGFHLSLRKEEAGDIWVEVPEDGS